MLKKIIKTNASQFGHTPIRPQYVWVNSATNVSQFGHTRIMGGKNLWFMCHRFALDFNFVFFKSEALMFVTRYINCVIELATRESGSDL